MPPGRDRPAIVRTPRPCSLATSPVPPGAVRRTKSGEIPALSRNGDAPRVMMRTVGGDEPGRLVGRPSTPVPRRMAVADDGPGPSRATQWTSRHRWEIVAFALVLLAMHVVGFGLLVFVIQPQHHTVGEQAFGLGLGVTAYVFGLRHAFDADHIAAIDNTTRKLLAEGQRPIGVGFWFAIGHSAMVFLLTALVASGAGIAGRLISADSNTHETLGTIGTLVSAGFLYLIGLINLVALVGIVRVWAAMRRGEFDEPELQRYLDSRGLVARLVGRFGRAIGRPWQMVPLGMLFGLGFDTASEVALLVLAGSSAANGLPWYAVLVLPLLFAAGMSTLDFLDGLIMSMAYDWAFAAPVRKVYYNLSVTGLSVVVALAIGTIELAHVLHERAGWTGPLDAVAEIDLSRVGFVIVGLFVACWLIALAYWRIRGVKRRWQAQTRQPARHL